MISKNKIREPKRATPNYSVAAIDRALGLLDVIGGDVYNLTEIASRAGLSQATTLRYLYTLAGHDLVEREAASGNYRLGLHLFWLGQKAIAGRDPRAVALPHMQSLQERFGETVNLALRNQTDLILVEVIESNRPIKKASSVGDRDSWHSSGLGKAILAFLDQSEARDILSQVGMPRLTPKTTVSAERLLRECRRFREVGYAIDDEEGIEGVRCVASPVFDHQGVPRYGLSVSGPAGRLTLSALDEVGTAVRDAASSISRELGFYPETAT